MSLLDISRLYPSILDYSLCDARLCLVCCLFLCVYALWEVELAATTFAE